VAQPERQLAVQGVRVASDAFAIDGFIHAVRFQDALAVKWGGHWART
jgi:hypothetical protein